MNNGEIKIEQTEFGAYEVDIIGMMYLLKNKKVAVDSVVVSCMKSDASFVFLDTFVVGESINDTYILYIEDEDDDSHIARLQMLPGLNVQVHEIPKDTGQSVAKAQDFSDFMEDDDDLMSPYLEADDLMMTATYLVYPAELISAQATPELVAKETVMSAPQNVIHYEEALHRLKNGETVSLDKTGDGEFELVQPGEALAPQDILKGVWALAHTPIAFPSVDEMADRLASFLAAVTPKEEEKVSKEDLLHDMSISDFLKKLRDSSDE